MKTFLMLVLTLLALASSALAQGKCTLETVMGIYGITCSGSVACPLATCGPALNGTLVPFAALGTVTNQFVDGFATSTSITDESIGGVQFTKLESHASENNTPKTDIVVNLDCTGSITYHPVVLGFPTFHQNFHILDSGKEVRAFSTGDGDVVTCDLRLMSRNTQ